MLGAQLPCQPRRSFIAIDFSAVTEAARWEGMHSPFQQQLMDHSLRVIALARPLVEAIARRDRDLGSQLRRALNSVNLNLAEGVGSGAGNARLRFESALGSLYEARAGLRAGIAWGFVSAQDCAEALEVSHALGGRLYGLTRR